MSSCSYAGEMMPGGVKSAYEIFIYEKPLVDQLINTVTKHQMTITRLPLDEELDALCLGEVAVRIKDHTFHCLVDNEYGDIDQDYLPLMLNMVLMELEDFDDVGNFSEWTRGNGFSTNSKIAHDLWQKLPDNRAQIRKLIVSETKAVSS